MTTERFVIETPLGPLCLVATPSALLEIRFAAEEPTHSAAPSDLLADAARQLGHYFGGARRRFELPLAPRGTAFQRQVWQALLEIDFGHTCSYSELARRIGRPGAARAVGAANRVNPLSLVVPCHRVIGVSGKLTGYAGGLERKAWLLAHELRVRDSMRVTTAPRTTSAARAETPPRAG